MKEDNQRESVYNIFGQLATRIDQIRRYKLGINKEDKVSIDDIADRIFNLDPSLTLPLIDGHLENIQHIIDNQGQLEKRINKSLVDMSKFLISSKKITKGNSSETSGIKKSLIKELQEYKEELSTLYDRLELLNIESASKLHDKLEWDLPVIGLCDLFNLLRRNDTITESSKGQLVSFIAQNFSVKNSINLSKLNVRNQLSGEIKDSKVLIKLLADLQAAASKL